MHSAVSESHQQVHKIVVDRLVSGILDITNHGLLSDSAVNVCSILLKLKFRYFVTIIQNHNFFCRVRKYESMLSDVAKFRSLVISGFIKITPDIQFDWGNIAGRSRLAVCLFSEKSKVSASRLCWSTINWVRCHTIGMLVLDWSVLLISYSLTLVLELMQSPDAEDSPNATKAKKRLSALILMKQK